MLKTTKRKKIQEDVNGKTSCAHGSEDDAKMAVLPEAVHRFSATSIKIPKALFVAIAKSIRNAPVFLAALRSKEIFFREQRHAGGRKE